MNQLSTGGSHASLRLDHLGFAPAGGLRPIDVFDWTLCASLEFPTAGWPGPGSGNVITWPIVGCNLPEPEFVFKVAGYIYMGAYDPSQMSVVPHPSSGKVQVGDCQSNVHDVTFPPPFEFIQGTAGFAMEGWDACLGIPLPVEPTTWGKLKMLGAE